MSEGILTAEELALLSDRAQRAFAGTLDIRYPWQFRQVIHYLCYELAQAKQEIKRLELEALRDEKYQT